MCNLIQPVDSFFREERIPIAQPRRIGANRTSVTLKKWIERGYRSKATDQLVQLEGCYEGQTLCTTREAYLRFLAKINGFEPNGDE